VFEAVLALILIAAALGFWIIFMPIHWRAVKTGRLLARGVVYDRRSTPARFWAGLVGMLSIGLILTLCAGVFLFRWSFP
jgi:hypothetical protein